MSTQPGQDVHSQGRNVHPEHRHRPSTHRPRTWGTGIGTPLANGATAAAAVLETRRRSFSSLPVGSFLRHIDRVSPHFCQPSRVCGRECCSRDVRNEGGSRRRSRCTGSASRRTPHLRRSRGCASCVGGVVYDHVEPFLAGWSAQRGGLSGLPRCAFRSESRL